MTSAVLSLFLLLAPEEDIDEVDALQVAIQAALARIDPAVVRIETAGGVRKVDLPIDDEKKMSVPERPCRMLMRPRALKKKASSMPSPVRSTARGAPAGYSGLRCS